MKVGATENQVTFDCLSFDWISLKQRRRIYLPNKFRPNHLVILLHISSFPFTDDLWNVSFYVLVFVLILLACLSSLIDLHLKRRRHDKMLKERDHYKTPPRSLVTRLLLTCSIARNWYRLNQEPNGKIGRELRFLDCFKFFAMFLVIFAHTNWVIYESAISNPQDPERLLHTAAGTLLISGSLITVTFFVISGLLLTINWLAVTRALADDKLGTWSFGKYAALFVKFNVFRYIRLTVPYGFVVLLSGVYFENAGGPLWRHIYQREQLACRKNWWTNLLFINNYVGTDERVSKTLRIDI